MSKSSLISMIFLLLCSLAMAALPPQLSSRGNPKLYNALLQKADENLSKLDLRSRQVYNRMLRQYPDAVMAFLIAYEADSNLAATDRATILSNYHAILAQLDAEGLHYSPEFFLSYIAKQTVSDERITPYRQAFLDDGLLEIRDKYPDLTERFRQVALWCVERLRFQPTSGRDMSPTDIAYKSLLGRCEEMQILFVAAARTVGIPSRPASTPWWAHIDNNHAWAEIFLDGAWYYTGDMDAAYFPNQTWFSGLIDKTVMILADGSLADETDEVISRGRYDATINSTRNYAGERTRLIKLRVSDSAGNPASKAGISILVYNWGSLRNLAYLETDSEGYREFSVGRGAFFMMLSQGSELSLIPVPSSEEEVIELTVGLSSGALTEYDLILDYPSNPMNWQSSPESWNTAADAAKAKIAEALDGFTVLPLPDWADPADSLFSSVMRLSHYNSPSFLRFASSKYPLEPGFLKLLEQGDPKLLWQAQPELFSALYDFYLEYKDKLAALPMQDAQYLFSPAVFFEDLPVMTGSNRASRLYPRSFVRRAESDLATVRRVSSWMSKRYKIDGSKSLSGLLPLHIAQRQIYLSSYQYRILAVSALRANGIPAQFSRIPDLVLALIEGDWQYYNVLEHRIVDPARSEEEVSIPFSLSIKDEGGYEMRVAPEQLQLSILSGTQLYPINQSLAYIGSGIYEGSIPSGGIYLQIGYRISDNQTAYQLHHLYTEADSLHLSTVLSSYPRSWAEAEQSILALLDGVETSAYEYILIGNYNQENSLRIAQKLTNSGKSFLFLGYDGASPAHSYMIAPAWQRAVSEDRSQALRTFTLVKKDASWQAYDGFWENLPE